MEVFLCVITVAWSMFVPALATQSPHPNILFIVADDLRVQLGYNTDAPQQPFSTSPVMVTPNLDDLAKRSLVLHRAYVQQAICNPSRSSVLTSRRPDTTRVYNNLEYFRESGGNFTTIPQFFKEQGYTTLGMGKIFHQAKLGWTDDDPMSWSEPFYRAPNVKYWRSKELGSNKEVSPAMRKNIPLPDEQVAERAVESLRRVAEDGRNGIKPFFLGVGFIKPHLPFVYPAEMLDHYPMPTIQSPANYYAPVDMPSVAWNPSRGFYNSWDMKAQNASTDYNTTEPLPHTKIQELRRAYYACATHIDELIGDVLTELEAQGLENNTIIVFWGDHGWHLGEHGAWGKSTNFELATRVPFLVHIPGVTDMEDGLSTNNLVEMVDLFPTLVEAAGFPSLPTCPQNSSSSLLCTEGKSLLPLIDDPAAPWKDAAFSQIARGQNRMGYSMKTERYRYTEWVGFVDGQPDWGDLLGTELYDHLTDPEENINRLNEEAYKEVTEELSVKLHEGWRAVDLVPGQNQNRATSASSSLAACLLLSYIMSLYTLYKGGVDFLIYKL